MSSLTRAEARGKRWWMNDMADCPMESLSFDTSTDDEEPSQPSLGKRFVWICNKPFSKT